MVLFWLLEIARGKFVKEVHHGGGFEFGGEIFLSCALPAAINRRLSYACFLSVTLAGASCWT